jgi:antibiotic biosynthesis monooxygenase (ABM) superfamily enzyme
MISQRVREGREDEFQRWQERTNEVASNFGGFEGQEVIPPEPGGERVWVAVFRFSSVGHLNEWLYSPARQELLEEGRPLFDGPGTQQVLVGGKPPQEVVTAVISHRVRPGCDRDFVRWQNKILRAQEKFPGFMGSELFEPVPGLQDDWVVVFRFDTREHLDGWLESDTRESLLEEGRRYFLSYDVRKIKSAFGSWFQFDGGQDNLPPNWKQAMSVLLALYPTVMFLNLTVGKGLTAAGVPGFLALFIGNMLSVAMLTWLLMPLVNRIFAFWLVPGRANTVARHVVGAAVVMLCYALFILIFALITR